MSFCGRDKADKAVARSLLARLNAQPFEAWIYERPGELDPPNGDVSARLRRQIRRSGAFVPLVTRAGFESEYVREEIDFALGLARGATAAATPLIAPLAPASLEAEPWPQPFGRLREFGPLYFHPDQDEAIEPVISHVCDGLGQGYLPPDPFHVRLPLRRRLMIEIGEATPIQAKYDAGIYDSLLQSALGCEQAQASGDTQGAAIHLSALRQLMTAEFGKLPGYYPRIAEGSLQAEAGQLQEARATFKDAIGSGEGLVDESAYGGVGYTYLREGEPFEALNWYEKAAQLCPRPDPAIAFNLLLCQVATSARLDLGTVEKLLGEDGRGAVCTIA